MDWQTFQELLSRRGFFCGVLLSAPGYLLRHGPAARAPLPPDPLQTARPPRPACRCGMVSRDRDLPYRQAVVGGAYHLLLTPRRILLHALCISCGGHLLEACRQAASCNCGFVPYWAAKAGAPFHWDGQLLECFVLAQEVPRRIRWPVYFCPSCGGRLADEAPEGAAHVAKAAEQRFGRGSAHCSLASTFRMKS